MKYFGTDGIRGKVNKEISVNLALKIGKSLIAFEEETIIIGVDTRISSDMLKYAIISGALSAGKKVIDCGVLTTPMVMYYSLVKKTIGIIVTASHNKYSDNGIKIFINGEKISKEQELKIEDLIEKEVFSNKIGKYIKDKNKVKNTYINFIKKHMNKTNLKIAIDLANGSTCCIAPSIFKRITNNLSIIGNKPNGYNINNNVGSTNIKTLQKFIQKNNIDIGFSFDGDGDRVIIATKEKIYTGDEIIYIIANYLQEKNKLNKNSVVLTNFSNQGIINAFHQKGIITYITEVGDKNIFKEMKNKNISLGAEPSGHIIVKDLLPFGDGIFIALLIIKILNEKNKLINELLNGISLYNEEIINCAKVNNLNKIISIISNYNEENNHVGKMVIRKSGTEDIYRILISHKNLNILKEYKNIILKELNKNEE